MYGAYIGLKVRSGPARGPWIEIFRTRLVSVLVKLSPEKLEVLAEIAQKLVADQEPAAPAGVDPEEAELQRRVADYERELREEQEARRRSEAPPDTSETA